MTHSGMLRHSTDDTSTVAHDSQRPLEPKDWRLKSMDPETIRSARLAARKNGLRLGAWVARAISSAASEELGRNSNNLNQNYDKDLKSFYDRLLNFEEKIEKERVLNEQRFIELQNGIKTITYGIIPALEKASNSGRSG